VPNLGTWAVYHLVGRADADLVDVALGVLVALVGVGLLVRRAGWHRGATSSRLRKKRDGGSVQDTIEKAKV
jgi:hypothetical protein